MEATRQLITPNLFPSWNTVYVDLDYQKLRSKGLIAFNNLYDATQAFNPGGVAAIKYGITSATNPGLILVGVGTFSHTSTPNLGVSDFISVIGQGKDSSIISPQGSSDGIIINISNCTIQGIMFNGGGNGLYVGDVSPTIRDCYMFGTTYSVRMSPFDGRFLDCIFFGGSSNVNDFGGGSGGAGYFENCKFLGNSSDCYESSSVNNAPIFKNCFFENSSSIINVLADFNGNFYDCSFNNTSPGEAYCIDGRNGGGGVGGSIYSHFKNCIFVGQGTVINRLSSGSILENCYIRSSGNTNGTAITGIENGAVIYGCKIMGNGSGRAISAGSGVSAIISHCSLRLPTGDVVGTSISSNITNLSIGGGSSNEEFPSAVNF